MITATSLVVRPNGWTATTQQYVVIYSRYMDAPVYHTHTVTLEWDGSTDRPNLFTCDCGRRSCVPLRLVRDLEKHNGLPRVA